ncbi:hypothetical protein SSTG_02262 [Streptomyces sp. e14]|nr:hypothetical protein SSTG_02262 [Streptomyces sp. e14]
MSGRGGLGGPPRAPRVLDGGFTPRPRTLDGTDDREDREDQGGRDDGRDTGA